ncbi:DUF4123 domain-containing protein [Pseudomonas sichuanensis]
MSAPTPWQWMARERASGRDIVLILDAGFDARQALMARLGSERWCALYHQTEVAHLAAHGPVCFLIGEGEVRLLQSLLEAPHDNWGWLASLAPGELAAWVEHWRARLLLGQRPQRALYRFHDNRELARVMTVPEHRAAWLGQAISVCYWQATAWQVVDNPAPRAYPAPSDPSWFPSPAEAASDGVVLANAHRYLCSRHLPAYSALAESQPPLDWLASQLRQSRAWGWHTGEAIEFLLMLSLHSPGYEVPRECAPLVDESPQVHLERLRLRTVF